MNGSPNTVDIDSSKEQIYSDKIIQNFNLVEELLSVNYCDVFGCELVHYF